jgi:hypothetical protein
MYRAPLGLNIAPVNYWSPCPFLDQVKAAVITVDTNKLTLGVPLELDMRNWTLLASPDVTLVRVLQAGQPTIAVAGTGAFAFDAVGTQGHGTTIALTTPTPEKTVVKLVRTDWLPKFKLGDVFTPDFLATVAGASVLRFMDWNQTNDADPALNTPITSWTPATVASYSKVAMPIEVTAELCNTVGSDCWFPLPSTLDLREARRVVELLDKLLLPWLKIHIEWSNEVWNTAVAFKTGRYALKQPGGAALYYGQKCAEAAKNLAGIKRTSLKLCWKWVSPQQVQGVIDAYKNAGGPWAFVDSLNFAPYPWNDKNPVSFYMPDNHKGLLDELNANRIAMAAKCLGGWVAVSKTNGKPLGRYEEALSPFPKGTAETAFAVEALKMPQAGDIIVSLWNDLDAAGCETGCFYTSAAQGVFGFGPDYAQPGYPQKQAWVDYNRIAWPMSRAQTRP